MKIQRFVLAAVALLALSAAACDQGDTIIQGGDGSQRQGISVSASGRALGTPDVVILQVGVDVEMRTVEAAREAAARGMQAVIDSLKANGVAEKDIQTVQFSVSPQYDFAANRQTLRGYRVSNVVTAKLRKIDAAGKAIDDASNAGGNAAVVRSVSSTIDDPSKLQQEARQKAMELAKDHAAPRTGDATTPIQTGELEVVVTVNVVYAIE